MVELLFLEKKEKISIREICDVGEVKSVLTKILFVPDIRLKPRIVQSLINYLQMKLADENYKIKIIAAYHGSEPNGFVICQIDPYYTSYGRKCCTFGWIIAQSFNACRLLIENCERFAKNNRIRKLRGPINSPKGFGGIGLQIEGFEYQMMYGVAFGDPKSRIFDYLTRLGYKVESEYTCMKVTKKTWDSGKIVDKNIKLRYLTLDELIEIKEEIFNLGKRSFQMNFPDASGAEARFLEMIETYRQVPTSYYKIRDDFNPNAYSIIPEFVEAWETCNLEEVVTWTPMAFERRTHKLVGAIFSLPDLYELWLGNPITRNNVDTAMVDKEYAGKGIFSALNNVGQLTCNLNGIKYIEGTSIWYNNKKAVNSIFPHCKHIRKHLVFQKRVK